MNLSHLLFEVLQDRIMVLKFEFVDLQAFLSVFSCLVDLVHNLAEHVFYVGLLFRSIVALLLLRILIVLRLMRVVVAPREVRMLSAPVGVVIVRVRVAIRVALTSLEIEVIGLLRLHKGIPYLTFTSRMSLHITKLTHLSWCVNLLTDLV